MDPLRKILSNFIFIHPKNASKYGKFVQKSGQVRALTSSKMSRKSA